MSNGPKNCSNLNHRIFSIFIDQCEGNSVEKKSLLVIWTISRLFVKTLTVNDKYSLLNIDNLKHLIQMQLSLKRKNFLKCLNGRLNFQNFQRKKKMTVIADLFPKLRTPESVVG